MKIKTTFTLPCRCQENAQHVYKIIDAYDTFSDAFEDGRDFMHFLFNNTDIDIDTDCIKIEMEVLSL